MSTNAAEKQYRAPSKSIDVLRKTSHSNEQVEIRKTSPSYSRSNTQTQIHGHPVVTPSDSSNSTGAKKIIKKKKIIRRVRTSTDRDSMSKAFNNSGTGSSSNAGTSIPKTATVVKKSSEYVSSNSSPLSRSRGKSIV